MSGEAQPCRRGDSFDEVADLYDRYRPAPPSPVVEALVNLTDIGPRTRVVEFGCGIGQLSVPLAATGAELTCVEPGVRLRAIAARNLSQFRTARVECVTFEDWPLGTERFDAVVVANAFHWLDTDLRFTKPAELLRAGGSLAILHTHHVHGGTPGFAEASQDCYLRSGLAADLTFRPPHPDELPASYPELDICGAATNRLTGQHPRSRSERAVPRRHRVVDRQLVRRRHTTRLPLRACRRHARECLGFAAGETIRT